MVSSKNCAFLQNFYQVRNLCASLTNKRHEPYFFFLFHCSLYRVCGNDVGPLWRPVIARCMTGCMTNSFCYSGRQSRRRGRRTLGKYFKFAYFGPCILRLHAMLIMGAMIPRYILGTIAHHFHNPYRHSTSISTSSIIIKKLFF